MRDGAVEKKWRRVIIVGGRTPAPRAARRRARRILQLLGFILSLEASVVHIQFTYPVHIGAAWATAAPARVMVPCACCSEACAVRQSCAVTAAGASRAPKLRRHTAWACTAPGRLPKVRSKSQYPRHIFGCFIREPEGASSQRVSWGTLKRVARPSAHDRVIRHKCTYAKTTCCWPPVLESFSSFLWKSGVSSPWHLDWTDRAPE